ncbi:glycosyl hydrolase family 18 protein [Bacillus sp. CGMCC 1.16607]|uniref:glycosyl hydrolase family 18 protein n=1 Tax=Bacillus sp. CGMCC 1.16607 TaxID=3351842 RepID=UPI0036356672
MSRVEYYKKKTTPIKWIVTGLILAMVMIVSSILLLLYPFASKEKADYFQGENPILFQNRQNGNALIDGETVFIPISFIKEQLDESIIFDEKSNSIIITTQNKVIQMPTESLTYYVNEKPVKLHFPAIQSSNGELYVALEPLLAYYPIQYKKLDGTNAIWIQTDGEELTNGTVGKKEVHEEKLRLRTDATLQSAYTANIKNNEKIYIEGEKEEYLFVRKEDGTAGYLHKELIKKGQQDQIVITKEEKTANLLPIKGPIRLTWEAVYNRNPDTSQLPEMPGINVVSPTWFELEDGEGNIKNLGSLDYVKWAKSKNYQVWGLFSNAFEPEMTHLAFKDYETRQKMIRQLLHYSQMYHLNGINIDIENVNVEDGPFITQFVREATPLLHEAGLTVSMDITFISTSENWSVFYEREKLGKVVDYLIVMAYDEHWGSSPVAGSVASFPWVEKNIENLLAVVPNERLILGVPLYTRLWKEQVLADGKVEVSSKAISMTKAKEWLNENGIKPIYDSSTGQNYAELFVKAENSTYKVWLEDELSLKKRSELVGKYQLAGVASWSRFFADNTAWTALHQDDKNYTKK